MTTSFDALMAAIQAPATPAPTMAINPPPMVAVTRTEELPAVIDPAKAETVAPVAEVPARRKRRTKAEMAAAQEAVNKPLENIARGRDAATGINPDELGTVQCDPQPKTDPAPAQEPKPIGTLYVSCMPDHDAENGAYIFNAANATVSEQAGLADYRQAEYNKLQGHFVAAVVSRVKDIRPEHLFVDTRWAETNACLATLIAMSEKVVRAL